MIEVVQFLIYIALFWWVPLSIFALLSTVNQAIYFTYFWQLKEYRLDRMLDFIRTKSGSDKIFTLTLKTRIFCFAVYILTFIFPSKGLEAAFLTYFMSFGLVVMDLLGLLRRALRRKLYRPQPTLKAILIVFLTIIISIGIPLLFIQDNGVKHFDFSADFVIPYSMLFAAGFATFINALIVLGFYPITIISKNLILAKAKRRMAQMQGLKVIAITGSYGKSSVKEFLATILSKKFKVLKTPGNTNTEIGVAGIIMKELKPEHQIMIVEAGAYKKGEISKIAKLVQPRISIITAVKDAHLALFGSIENLKKAKFELVEELPEYGIAILNQDNQGSKDLTEWAKQKKLAKVIGYGFKEKTDLSATNIVSDNNSVSFQVDGIQFTTLLPGEHNISNILAAMAAAMELGIGLEEMQEAVSELKLREHTMSVVKISEKLTIIDDTYNANPDGLMAGLNYLSKFNNTQKIIVFPGMLELGERSDQEHQRVAAEIARICDQAVFTSRDFEKSIKAGLGNVDQSRFVFIEDNLPEMEKHLLKLVGQNPTVIYFSSRGAEKIIEKLKKVS